MTSKYNIDEDPHLVLSKKDGETLISISKDKIEKVYFTLKNWANFISIIDN